MICRCCKDQATHLDSESRPVCEDCYVELEFGMVRNHNLCIAPPGRPAVGDEDSPGWQNMIRAIEDHASLEPLM